MRRGGEQPDLPSDVRPESTRYPKDAPKVVTGDFGKKVQEGSREDKRASSDASAGKDGPAELCRGVRSP